MIPLLIPRATKQFNFNMVQLKGFITVAIHLVAQFYNSIDSTKALYSPQSHISR